MATIPTSEAATAAVPMPCVEMLRLRDQCRLLQEKLRDSRRRAREHEKSDRRSGDRSSHANDYEHFLQRKLLKNSLLIARHIAEHGCEKLGHSS